MLASLGHYYFLDGFKVRETVVAKGVALSDLRVISSKCDSLNLGCFNPSWAGYVALPVERSRTASELRYSMQVKPFTTYAPGMTCAVAICLKTKGDDIIAAMESARYINENGAFWEQDIFGDPPPAICYPVSGIDWVCTSTATRKGFGIDQLTMAVGGPTKYTVTDCLTNEATLFIGTNVTVDIDVASAFPNNVATNTFIVSPGATVIFRDPPPKFSVTGRIRGEAGQMKFVSSNCNVHYPGCVSDNVAFGIDSAYSEIPVFTNVVLTTITNLTAYMGGTATGCKWAAKDTYHFRNDGTKVTAQFQTQSGAQIYAIKVTLTQNGSIVMVKSSAGNYKASETGGLGFDMETTTATRAGLDICNDVSKFGICAGKMTLYCTEPRLADVTLAMENETTVSSVVAEGNASLGWGNSQATSRSSVPNTGRIIVRDGGKSTMSYNNHVCSGEWANHVASLFAEPGGTLSFTGTYPIDNAFWVEGRGGTVDLNTSTVLSGYWRLKNGTRVTGDKMEMGYLNTKSIWIIDGSAPSTNDARIVFYPKDNVPHPSFQIIVDDVPGDGPDFVQNGVIAEKDPSKSLTVMRDIVKLGTGTMRLNAVNTYLGDTVISNGVVELGVNNALSSVNDVRLDGGVIGAASGTVNALGRLTVGKAGGGFRLAADSQLSFEAAEVAELDSGKYILISGRLGSTSLRIGTSRCLNAGALRQFKHVDAVTGNLRRVTQNDNGYLTGCGVMLIIR